MNIEILERAARASAVLLRAEAVAASGEGVYPAVLLTFDLGRILLAVDAKASRLSLLHLEQAEDAPSGRNDVGEEEPWWRLIGSPLCGAQPLPGDGDDNGIRLQFRADADAPRFVRIAPRGAALLVLLEAPTPPATPEQPS